MIHITMKQLRDIFQVASTGNLFVEKKRLETTNTDNRQAETTEQIDRQKNKQKSAINKIEDEVIYCLLKVHLTFPLPFPLKYKWKVIHL